MILEPDMSWPPIPSTITDPMKEWSAWFSGDPKVLAETYSKGVGSNSVRPSYRVRDIGVIPAVRRFFWGAQESQQSPRTKLHMPLAADLATSSSDLLFGEELKLDIQGTGPGADRLIQILEENAWQSLLPEAAEVCAGLGGVYLRAGWDKSIADNALISVLHADQAIPEFRYGRLVSVIFWQVTHEDKSHVYRHLETHVPGQVRHELYMGTADKLGIPVPLTESPVTAGFALEVDAEAGIPTGFPGLDVVHVPNIRPSRRWRTVPEGRYLGRSDYDGLEGPLDALDEAWTSWMRDIRHGKSRILAPDYMLEPLGPGQGATMDMDREVYVGLKAMATEGGLAQQITPHQFAIRTKEHNETIQALMKAIVQGAGYSGQTFGLASADEAAKTATEVSSVNRRTSQTREKKSRYWTNALERFMTALSAIDAHQFGSGPAVTAKVTFPDASAPTQTELAQTVQMLHAAQSASAKTRVLMLHPEWTDKEVEEEVALLMEEFNVSPPTADEFGIEEAPTLEPDAVL